ncbi:uncharacterized protein LOC129571996 [Sitodiplosis mosellana]|uniref:uncharacterized protein LOC129571996 n=1 Tax=Sitodiplosis mosellana TaxID=263140 RepID=UPI002443C549|nr:uncharacterized protein LOC129571996 [Sitodiplosis mosellana]
MELNRRNTQCDCRVAGTVLGSIGILISIGCGLLFTYVFLSMGANDFGLAVAAIAVLNCVASIVWIWGISKKKIGFLTASIIWWIVPLCVCLLFLIIYISVSDDNASNTSHKRDSLAQFFESLFNMVAISGTAFCLIFYIVAVVCFIKIRASIRKSRSENLRLGISYTAACTKNPDFHIY